MRVLRLVPSFFSFILIAFIAFGSPAKSDAQTSTTTILNVTPACLQQGCVTTLTATVTSGGTAVHPGLVYFCAGTADCESGAPLGTAQLLANGTAMLKLQIEPGEETIHAVFHGTKSYSKSASSPQIITITPNAAGKATTISAPAAFSVGGDGLGGHYSSIDFFGFMSGVRAAGPLGLTGTVTFTDQSRNNATLATAPLMPYPITASYQTPLTLAGVPSAVQSGTKYTVPADFNNDGLVDLAVVDGNGVLSILLGDGTGNFIPGPAFNGATGAHGPPLVGDFNGDGKLDVAIPDSSLKKIHISLGKGDGTFTSLASVNVGDSPLILYRGDFNNDGIPDVLSLGATADTKQSITILLGTGDGSYTSLAPFPADATKSVAIADFNQDGKLDLAYGLNGIQVAKGNGDGTFSAPSPLMLNQPETFVVAGDFDGDGIPDIVYAGLQYTTFLRGNGDLTFADKGFVRDADQQNHYTPLITGAFAGFQPQAVGGQGGVLKVGAIVASLAGNGAYIFESYKITQQGGAGILPGGSATSTNTPYEFAVADFTGDGVPDVVSFQTGGTGLLSGYAGALGSNTYVQSTNQVLLDAGVHNIVATYSGDAFHSSAVSAPSPIMGRSVAYGNGFSGETGLVTNGSATIADGILQLTDGGQNEAGSMFAPTRVGKSFITDFDFQISNANADGLAFVFQDNGPNALGSSGGGIGYGNPPGGIGPSITNSFAFVLDLHNNQGEGSNSVRFALNGVTSPATSVDLTPSGIDLHSGHTFHVQISTYQRFYSFFIVDETPGPNGPVTFEQDFTLPLDQLDFGMGYVGFTAATGQTTSAVKIFNWTVEDNTTANLILTYPRPSFPNGFPAANSGLSFRGGAGISGSAIQLTNGTQFAATSAFLAPPVQLQYPPYYRTFSTDFDFVIDGGVGDGFAFVLRQALGAVGPSGGGLGYGPATPGGQGTGIANSFAIKFDLHDNAGESPNSTGVYLNGASPTVPSIDLTPSGIKLSSGHPFHAQITSDGSTLKLSITDLVQYKVFTQVLYSGSELATMIPASPYAGFTAGTGATPSSIKILNWTWSSY